MLGTAPISAAPIATPQSLGTDPLIVQVSEALGVTPGMVALSVANELIAEALGLAPQTGAGQSIEGALEDAAGLNSAVIAGEIAVLFETMACYGAAYQTDEDLDAAVAESAGFVGAVAGGRLLASVLAEALRMMTTSTVVRSFLTQVTEQLGIDPELSYLYAVRVVDRIRLASTLAPNSLRGVDVQDMMRLVDATWRTLPADMTEAAAIAQSESVQQAIRVVEKLQLSRTLVGSRIMNMSIVQAVRLAESLARFFGADIEEALGVEASVAARALAIAAASDSVSVAETASPQFLLAAIAADTLEISASDAVQMLISPAVVEGLELRAGYVAPDGSFTAWAMNTRNAAVTEYTNFEFNSFLRMSNQYVGASSSGLYELLGDDDDGTDIIAKVRSGYMQFGGTRLSRPKAAYLATRRGGDFVLKIITAEDDEYIYAVSTRNMRSTKVHMGKGLRARYFAFELIGDGSDFDLDTLEFVPLVVNRRV